MEQLGRHLVIELWGCNDSINDTHIVRQAMLDAIQAANATLLEINVHTFSPHGVTGVAVLAESHLSVHSWPEHGYLAADVFTCGTTTKPMAAADVLRRYFEPETVELQDIPRGIFPGSREPRPRTRRRRWQRTSTPTAIVDEDGSPEAAAVLS